MNKDYRKYIENDDENKNYVELYAMISALYIRLAEKGIFNEEDIKKITERTETLKKEIFNKENELLKKMNL